MRGHLSRWLDPRRSLRARIGLAIACAALLAASAAGIYFDRLIPLAGLGLGLAALGLWVAGRIAGSIEEIEGALLARGRGDLRRAARAHHRPARGRHPVEARVRGRGRVHTGADAIPPHRARREEHPRARVRHHPAGRQARPDHDQRRAPARLARRLRPLRGRGRAPARRGSRAALRADHAALSRARVVERDENGRAPRLSGTDVDITERKLAAQRIHYFATHVLCIGIDRFTTINNSLGHRAGDRVLKGLAERITTHAGKHDVVARPGGDEFLLLLPRINAPRGGPFGRAAARGDVDADRDRQPQRRAHREHRYRSASRGRRLGGDAAAQRRHRDAPRQAGGREQRAVLRRA